MTASGDQTVALWDVEAETKTGLYKGHTSSVKTVDVCAWEPCELGWGKQKIGCCNYTISLF